MEVQISSKIRKKELKGLKEKLVSRDEEDAILMARNDTSGICFSKIVKRFNYKH